MSRYLTKNGGEVSGVTRAQLLAARATTLADFGVSLPLIAESASFSMSMVVRAALGLSAADSRITIVATDSLEGCVALATARHLTIAGGSPIVVLAQPPAQQSDHFAAQLHPLIKMNVGICEWVPSEDETDLRELISGTHCAILGITDLTSSTPQGGMSQLVAVLNDLPTPLHCIECPFDVDPDTGKGGTEPLYASSTLSLGAPLAGLIPGKDFVGRHYVCDASLPPTVYEQLGIEPAKLFADQPVIQISPAA